MTGIALEDATGKPYVKLMDFVKIGLPASLIALCIVVSLGYLLMLLVGY